MSISKGYSWFNNELSSYFKNVNYSNVLFNKLCWLNPIKYLGI